MKTLIINKDNINEEEVDSEVVRVKALIIDSRGKVLLAHNNDTYQFPGGHLDEGESLEDCVKREIMEETGIDLDSNLELFLNIIGYYDNYFGTGRKVKCSIYYYRIITDKVPDYNRTHYDELELRSDFNLYYVKLKGLDSFLEKCILDGSMNEEIGREMVLVCCEYQKMFGGIE